MHGAPPPGSEGETRKENEMGNPDTGEIYELPAGASPEPGDVGLTSEQAAHLRSMDLEDRKRELEAMIRQRAEQADTDLRSRLECVALCAKRFLDVHAEFDGDPACVGEYIGALDRAVSNLTDAEMSELRERAYQRAHS